MAHKVFISHSSKDKLTADAICHALEANGVACWIAPRDVRAGFDYPAEIMYGIETCKVMVFVFSEESNNSIFVIAEVERAFSEGKIIIPYRLSQIEMNRNLKFLLSGKHWVDAYPNDTVFADLVNAVKNALGEQPDKPQSRTADDQAAAPGNDNFFAQELAKLQQEEDCLVYIAVHPTTWQVLFFYHSGIAIDKKFLLTEKPTAGNMGMHRQRSYDERGGRSAAGPFTVKGSTVDYTVRSKAGTNEMEWSYTCVLQADGSLEQFYRDKPHGTLIYCGKFANGVFYPNENFAILN